MNCKSGDLAVIVESEVEDNIGLFVDVIEPYCGPVELLESGAVWRCKAKGVIGYRNLRGERFDLADGPIPDRALRPIRPRKTTRNDEAQQQHSVFA